MGKLWEDFWGKGLANGHDSAAKAIAFIVLFVVAAWLIDVLFMFLQIAIDSNSIINKVSFGSDLFFSGHTGLPFLLALIWWRELPFRLVFLSFSFFFAIVVLLGHMHYSIDVLGAFFITYTIFHLLEKFFKKDRVVFYGDQPVI